jgi:hypothetical protein
MNPASCSLAPEELHAQFERYRAIGRVAAGVKHEPGRVVVRFADDPPSALIERTLEVERGCCPFFETDYDAASQRLTISVDQPGRRPSLDSIAHALMESRATALLPETGPDVTSCCNPTALETCCQPQAKPECCGQPTSGGHTFPAPSRCGCDA